MTQHAVNPVKSAGKWLLVVIGMFGFGYALVPLYDVFCDITGINGKPSNQAAAYQAVEIDEARVVKVEFMTRSAGGMASEFRPMVQSVKVHPGQLQEVEFYVKNPTDRDIVAQAVPSISPGPAALYMNKTECFCFEQQTLKAGEEVIMPMRFYVDPQLPQDISVFTLSYTLYDVSAQVVAQN